MTPDVGPSEPLRIYEHEAADNGQEGFVYVCGMRDGRSHAWLEREGLIVDITGDQFPDNDDPVCDDRRGMPSSKLTASTCRISTSMTTSRGPTWALHTRGYPCICWSRTTRRVDRVAAVERPNRSRFRTAWPAKTAPVTWKAALHHFPSLARPGWTPNPAGDRLAGSEACGPRKAGTPSSWCPAAGQADSRR
jgi:hypothetical protein